MRTPRFRFVVLCLILVAISFAALPSPCWGQGESKPSELAKQVSQLCREKKLDEAVALVRAKAAEESPAGEVPRVMFSLGRTLYFNGRNDEALGLLKDVAERFPMSDVATSAWLGVGSVHAAMMNRKEMIAAYERGLVVVPGRSRVYPADGNGLYSSACESLGHHYIESEQWDKGLQIHLDWVPSSSCGSCHWEMETDRANNIVLCLVQLERFDEAIDRLWREIGNSNLNGSALRRFVLVRLYAEAGQLNDLALLNLKIVVEATKQLPIDPATPKNANRLQAIINANAELAAALGVCRPNAWDEQLQLISGLNEQISLKQHVAKWMLIRNHQQTVPWIRVAAQRAGSQAPRFIDLLAAIDSPPARDELVRLAVDGDVYRQQYVCGLIRYRMKDPKPLIDEIVARAPADRKRQTNWNLGPAPLADRFYERWPVPKQDSLPKTLPADLFEVRQR